MRAFLSALILALLPLAAAADATQPDAAAAARARVADLRTDAASIERLAAELSSARTALAQRKGELTQDIAAFNASCNDSDSAGCESVRASLAERQEHLNTQIRAWDERRREYLGQRRELTRRAHELAQEVAGTPPADLAAPEPGLVTTFAESNDHILVAGERRHVELKLLRAAFALAAAGIADAVVAQAAPVVVGVKLTRWWPDDRAEWWAETPLARRIRREEVGVEGSAPPAAMHVYAVEAVDYTTPAGSFSVGENGAEKLEVKWPPSYPKVLTSPVSPGVTVSADDVELSLSAGVPTWVPAGGNVKVYVQQKWRKGGGK